MVVIGKMCLMGVITMTHTKDLYSRQILAQMFSANFKSKYFS